MELRHLCCCLYFHLQAATKTEEWTFHCITLEVWLYSLHPVMKTPTMWDFCAQGFTEVASWGQKRELLHWKYSKTELFVSKISLNCRWVMKWGENQTTEAFSGKNSWTVDVLVQLVDHVEPKRKILNIIFYLWASNFIKCVKSVWKKCNNDLHDGLCFLMKNQKWVPLRFTEESLVSVEFNIFIIIMCNTSWSLMLNVRSAAIKLLVNLHRWWFSK